MYCMLIFRVMRTQVKKLHSLPLREAAFIEVMECLAVPKIPDSPDWIYEVKLDGYRALAVSTHGTLNLFSRRRNSFNRQYPLVYEALGDLPENTVVDGEIVALDDEGKPNFSLLQHYASQASHIHYFIFDLLVYQNHDLTRCRSSSAGRSWAPHCISARREFALRNPSTHPSRRCSRRFENLDSRASLRKRGRASTNPGSAPDRGSNTG